MRSFDVVVIGAGPGGEALSGKLADAGLEVAIVEDRLVGGECSFWACMPSKALLRPAEAREEAGRVVGSAAPLGPVDVPAVLARRDEIVHGLDDASQMPWLEDKGIALVRGWGRLDGERRVRVGDEVLEARRAVVLAGGTTPALPPVEGLADVRPWTNREATIADHIPASLLIMGGGVVGVEMAQAFASLGAEVTIFDPSDRLLTREEPFAGELVRAALEARGVHVLLGVAAQSAHRDADGVHAHLKSGEVLSAQELLVATGRTPQTGGLGLETVGVTADPHVEADLHGRVGGRDWLYAIGDLNGRAAFTHMAKYQARIAADAILGREDTAIENPADGPHAPRMIFTDPQVGAVGHTTESAAEAGLDVEVIDVETSATAGGTFYGHGAAGTTRVLVDRARGVIAGATVTGSEVVDLLHPFTIAVALEIPLERLKHAVPVFPTRTELWLAIFRKAGVA